MYKYLLFLFLLASGMNAQYIPAQSIPSGSSTVLATIGLFGPVAFLYCAHGKYWTNTRTMEIKLNQQLNAALTNIMNNQLRIPFMQATNRSPDEIQINFNFNNPFAENVQIDSSHSLITGNFEWTIKDKQQNDLITFSLKEKGSDQIIVEKKLTNANQANLPQFMRDCTNMLLKQMRLNAFKRISAMCGTIFALSMGSAVLFESFFKSIA